jgi:hypothetical protein
MNKPWDPHEAATRLSEFLKKELSLGMPEEYLFSLPIGFAVGQYRKHAPNEMVRRRANLVVDAALLGAEHGLKEPDSN